MEVPARHRKKCRRYNIPGHAHELTFSCYRRQPFLLNDWACDYLAQAVIKAKEKHAFDVWAYVFMPEHVHLLICPRYVEYSISKILTSIKQSVARRAVRYLRVQDPCRLKQLTTGKKDHPYRFWQIGGGYDRNVTTDQAVIHMVRYIHNNPVRRGLVEHSQQWNYSSTRQWQEGVGPIPVDFESFPVP